MFWSAHHMFSPTFFTNISQFWEVEKENNFIIGPNKQILRNISLISRKNKLVKIWGEIICSDLKKKSWIRMQYLWSAHQINPESWILNLLFFHQYFSVLSSWKYFFTFKKQPFTDKNFFPGLTNWNEKKILAPISQKRCKQNHSSDHFFWVNDVYKNYLDIWTKVRNFPRLSSL